MSDKPNVNIYKPGSVPAIYQELLDTAPHLLIAGSTGSGKSTCLNGIIYTALYRDIDLICIDPKRVELYRYKRIAAIYADDIPGAENALKTALQLISDRFTRMQSQGVLETQEKPIYIVIDELADLLLTSKQARKDLVRILQIGRAAGVHCICCTQVVLAKILSTELLVNLDYRIALKTATAAHSRLILECNGAEKLPFPKQAGYAEMLVKLPGETRHLYMDRIPADLIEYMIDYRYQEKQELNKPVNKLKRYLKGLFK